MVKQVREQVRPPARAAREPRRATGLDAARRPPEWSRYSNREEALSREEHVALGSGAIQPFEFDTEIDGQFTLQEAIEAGLVGFWTGTAWLNIR